MLNKTLPWNFVSGNSGSRSGKSGKTEVPDMQLGFQGGRLGCYLQLGIWAST